jgi:hypothetical protein
MISHEMIKALFKTYLLKATSNQETPSLETDPDLMIGPLLPTKSPLDVSDDLI